MLSPADAALCARDRSLPTLSWALDHERLMATLNAALPGSPLAEVRPRYVRYKPGSSCLVACTLNTHRGTSVQASVRIFAPAAAPDKLASAHKREVHPSALGPGLLPFPALHADVRLYPNDHELTTLWRMNDQIQRRRLLDRCGIRDNALAEAEPVLLRYKPERRAVFKLSSGVRAVAVKLYTTEGFHRALRGADAAAGVPRPQLLAADEHARAIVWEWIDGRPIDLRCGPDLSLLGATLQSLRATQSLRETRTSDRRTELAVAADAIRALNPALGVTAADVAEQIAAALPGPRAGVFCHGDLAPDQMIVSGDELLLLDFDRVRRDHPVADAARLLARVSCDVILRGGPAPLPTLSDALAPGELAPALPAFTAAELLAVATDPFRLRRPDWPAEIATILSLAHETIAHATVSG